MAHYVPRVADGQLRRRLEAIGAVLIEGPKASGKTATASQVARTMVRLDADESKRMAVQLAPDRLFDGPTPILFDEWQVTPQIWNIVRHRVDDSDGKGLYILTGSATPNDDVRRHSGAGRVGVIRMRPMSLYETGHSTGNVSLSALLSGGGPPIGAASLTFDELVSRIVIGGWPELIDATESQARDWLDDYLSQLAEVDVQHLGVRRDPRRVHRLLAALARSVGQAVTTAQLARDVGGPDGALASETITSYLDALGRLHLLDNSEAWRPHMRSRARLRNAAVRYFVDPSIGPAALGVGSAELMADPQAMGFHFEALVARDLRVYAAPLRGRVDSWRDSNGREVDAVVSLPDGRWAAFEVKLNPAAVETAASSLRRFADAVDVQRHGRPAALGVITATGYAGRRHDGVDVIPISTLGP